MLLFLKSSIHSNIISLVHQFKADSNKVGDRVNRNKNKIGAFTAIVNDEVDAHNTFDITLIKAKLSDLEDRSRRTVILLKLRGVPESDKSPELGVYFSKLLMKALPDTPTEKLVIHCIHRLPNPKHLLAKIPRETITSIHFYHVKERLLALTRDPDHSPVCLQGLSLYAGLSPHTQGINIATITKPLHNHRIPCHWGYPVKLHLYYQYRGKRPSTTKRIGNIGGWPRNL